MADVEVEVDAEVDRVARSFQEVTMWKTVKGRRMTVREETKKRF
jgi:hypothetical protein